VGDSFGADAVKDYEQVVEKSPMDIYTRNHGNPSLDWLHGVEFSRSTIRRFLRDTRQSLAPYRNNLYSAYERSMASLFCKRSLRILMSVKPEWQDDIRRGFYRSRHIVEFGAISPQSFAEFDLVVPLSVSDMIQTCHASQLTARHALPFPSIQSVLLCDDKYEFNQTLINNGFARYIPEMGNALEPPYILKKRVSDWGRECWIVRNRNDEQEVKEQLNDETFFRQVIISGHFEFATHILFAKSRIVKSLNIMYEFESDTPIKGQQRQINTIIHHCPYLNLFAGVLRSIGFQGLCCVNYKVAHGRPYIFEINPRFGASLAPYFFSFVRHLSRD
jgi:hypothetical protein